MNGTWESTSGKRNARSPRASPSPFPGQTRPRPFSGRPSSKATANLLTRGRSQSDVRAGCGKVSLRPADAGTGADLCKEHGSTQTFYRSVIQPGAGSG